MNLHGCKFQANHDVICTVLDKDEATLMHLGTKLPYALNRTGLTTWFLLKDGCALDAIVERLQEEFDIEREKLRKDVVNFIEDLLSYKLIVATGSDR